MTLSQHPFIDLLKRFCGHEGEEVVRDTARQTVLLEDDLATSLNDVAANFLVQGRMQEAAGARWASRWHAARAVQMRAILAAAGLDVRA